ncbi:MAG TPA: hypothetical protein VF531_05760, partial [Bacillota bacterium]
MGLFDHIPIATTLMHSSILGSGENTDEGDRQLRLILRICFSEPTVMSNLIGKILGQLRNYFFKIGH